MRKNFYQPLTTEAALLKEAWMPCVNYCCLLQDIQQEIMDVDGTEEADKLKLERRRLGAELENLRNRVRTLIAETKTLNTLERRVLRLRYLCADPWDAIAAQVGRELSSVYTAHRKGLNKVAEFERESLLKKAG